jgi:hypothetical protein
MHKIKQLQTELKTKDVMLMQQEKILKEKALLDD